MTCKTCGDEGDRPDDVLCRGCSGKTDSCMRCDDEPSYVGHGASHYGERCMRELFGECEKCGAVSCRHLEFGDAWCDECERTGCEHVSGN